MNAVSGITIDPTVLADIGKGDASAGAARLRLAISDLRERKQIMGPTARPASVREAVRADEPALEALLAMDIAENGAMVAPFVLSAVQDLIRSITRETGRGVIGVVDGPGGEPVALVCLFGQPFWWSDVWYLEQKILFVHPDHRRSRHASDLVDFAHYCADVMTERTGTKTFVIEGVTATSRAEGKVRFMNRHSNFCGASFIYPHPGKADAGG